MLGYKEIREAAEAADEMVKGLNHDDPILGKYDVSDEALREFSRELGRDMRILGITPTTAFRVGFHVALEMKRRCES